jgi:hypothetical protein
MLTRIIKSVAAVLAVIGVFVMPAATMPLHCVLKAPVGGSGHPCPMMGMNSSADLVQLGSAPVDHSCCQISAATPESLTAPESPSGKGILIPTTTSTSVSDLPETSVRHELLDWTAPSLGGPPQAVLCTFLI